MHTAPHAGPPSGQGIQPAAYAFSIAPLLDFVEFRLHKILHQALFHCLLDGEQFTITLTTKLGTRTYAVTSVNKISETDNSLLAPTAENCVTLFTCVRNQSAYRWAVRAVEV